MPGDKRDWQPKVGNEFPIKSVEIIREWTRTIISLMSVTVLLGIIVGAAVVAISSGNKDPFLYSFAVAGPLLTAILGYYFGQKSSPEGGVGSDAGTGDV